MNILPKTTSTFSSREFNQDTARAKRAAEKGPVFITTRGEASHVLMTIADYERLQRDGDEPQPFRSLADVLADNRTEADFEFEIPEFKGTFKGFEFE